MGVPEILHVNKIRSLHLGPHQVLLTLSIDFADDVVSQRIEAIVTRLDRDIRDRFDTVHSVFLEVQSRDGHRAIAAAEPKVHPARARLRQGAVLRRAGRSVSRDARGRHSDRDRTMHPFTVGQRR